MSMTSKQRLLTALDGGVPDRLPVTTHFLMPQFLNTSMGGMSEDEFFDTCGWDPITYTTPHRPDPAANEYFDPNQGEPGFLESRRIVTDNWRVELRTGRRAGTPGDSIQLCDAQGHAKHGPGGRSVHGVGG